MKVLLSMLVGGVAVFLILRPATPIERTDPTAETVAAATPKLAPTPTPVPPPPTDEFGDLDNADGSLKRLPQGTKIEKFWGHIVQHLDDGRLLMQTNHGRLVLTLPGKDDFIDGTYLPKFDGAVTGTYRYATTDGATRTVWDVLYLPPETLPLSRPAPTPLPRPQAVAPFTPRPTPDALTSAREIERKYGGQPAR